jgi:hypothetical protein
LEPGGTDLGVLELLLILVFALHLVAVNTAAAAPLLCVAVEWRAARRTDLAASNLGRRLAILSLAALGLGALLGGLLLAILWHSDRAYWSALARVPAHRRWFTAVELAFYVACMAPYAMLWERARNQRFWHRLLAILAATNLLYHFPPLFTMLSLMNTRPELGAAVLDRALYVQLLTDPELMARVAHHWLASLATAGGVLLLLAAPRDRTAEQPGSDSTALFAARVALVATTLQLPAGLWLLLQLPSTAQTRLLGGDTIGTTLFAVAIVLAVLLLQQLTAASLGDVSRAVALRIVALMLAVLILMSSVLHRTRVGAGDPLEANPSPFQGEGRERVKVSSSLSLSPDFSREDEFARSC